MVSKAFDKSRKTPSDMQLFSKPLAIFRANKKSNGLDIKKEKKRKSELSDWTNIFITSSFDLNRKNYILYFGNLQACVSGSAPICVKITNSRVENDAGSTPLFACLWVV